MVSTTTEFQTPGSVHPMEQQIACLVGGPGRPENPFIYCVDWHIDGDRLKVRSDFLSPELEKDEEGYYLTADRVEVMDGREFRLLGRSDGIVKVAGKRVDLAKIQEVLTQIPGVQDAYLFSRPITQGRGNEILALVAGDVGLEAIRNVLQEKLEPYA